jgi:hypothetical protein
MTPDEHPERQDPSIGEGVSTEPDDVRAAMEHTREALEASAAELERAKRLLRETASLVEGETPPDGGSSGTAGGASRGKRAGR